MSTVIKLNNTIPEEFAQQRLDVALSKVFAEYSRAQIQQWIKGGFVVINDEVITQTRKKVAGGENISIQAEIAEQERWQAQAIPLKIIHEDESILVINKPSGLVVHPGAGTPDKTLLNALLHHAPELNTIPRAGIVHRLDKETSGLLVIAKTLTAQTSLVQQLQKRTVKREYEGIVNGVMTAGGTVDAPIGRHARQRTKMTVVAHGKAAISHYRIIEKYRAHTCIKIFLETGRTHQIRVHMAHIRYPLVGDLTYGGKPKFPANPSEALKDALKNFKRQALHARQLTLTHPQTQQVMSWSAPMPDDMRQLKEFLQKNNQLG